MAFQRHQHHGTVVQRGGNAGLDRQRLVQRGQCFFEALQLGKNDAAIVQRFEMVRLDAENAVIGGQRRFEL